MSADKAIRAGQAGWENVLPTAQAEVIATHGMASDTTTRDDGYDKLSKNIRKNMGER